MQKILHLEFSLLWLLPCQHQLHLTLSRPKSSKQHIIQEYPFRIITKVMIEHNKDYLKLHVTITYCNSQLLRVWTWRMFIQSLSVIMA